MNSSTHTDHFTLERVIGTGDGWQVSTGIIAGEPVVRQICGNRHTDMNAADAADQVRETKRWRGDLELTRPKTEVSRMIRALTTAAEAIE
jgi:hypothetical protein